MWIEDEQWWRINKNDQGDLVYLRRYYYYLGLYVIDTVYNDILVSGSMID